MAKKVTAIVKLQLQAGKATPGPPVGSTLGPYGINIPGFTKEFNAKTANEVGLIIPVVITIYQDRSFTFILKTPPAPVLIKKACGIETASAKPNKDKVAKLTKAQVEEIAKQKMPDLNAASLEGYCSQHGRNRRRVKEEWERRIFSLQPQGGFLNNETRKEISR